MEGKAVSPSPCIMVVNLGLSNARAIVFSEQGEKLAQASRPVRTVLHDGLVEQDPVEWWDAVRLVMTQAAAAAHVQVTHVTVTASSSCLVALDAQHEPLGPAIMVSDKRAKAEAIELAAHFPALFGSTTILPSPVFMIPKMYWLKKHCPELFARARAFVAPNDYLIAKLTGKVVTDPLNAEKAYYDLQQRTYPADVLAFLGITADQLPAVAPLGTSLGSLLPSVAGETGIDGEVILTTYDALCAFWGSGVVKTGDACLVGGTVLSLRAYHDGTSAAIGDQLLLQKFDPFPVASLGGSNNMGGSLVEWLRDCFYSGVADPYSAMANDARGSAVGAHGLLFLPYLLGERTPFYDPDVRGVFFGLERFHTTRDMVRSVYESIGFMALQMIEAIESAGAPVRELKTSGGLFRNEFVAKLLADVTGRPVVITEDPETTSFGAFLLVLKATTDRSIDDLSRLVRVRTTHQPHPVAHAAYQKIYPLFKKIYDDNVDNFKLRRLVYSSLDRPPEHTLSNL